MQRTLLLAWALLLAGIWSLAQAQSPAVRAVILNPPFSATTESIAFVGAADGGNASTTLTYSYTVGSGNNRLLVVAAVGGTITDDVSGATYNGVSMTLAVKQNPNGNSSNRWVYLFYLLNPVSGAHNVVVSGGSFVTSGAADYQNVDQSGQPDATITNQGTGSITTLTTSITTVANNSWPILVENGFGSGPPAAGTGLTRRTFDAAFGTYGIFDSNGPVTPAGAYSMTTTRSTASNTISHVVASFKP